MEWKLLNNKAVDNTMFVLPPHRTTDAKWESCPTKDDGSSMKGGMMRRVAKEETAVL